MTIQAVVPFFFLCRQGESRGEKPAISRFFFRYLNLTPEVAELELVTEVYLPLA